MEAAEAEWHRRFMDYLGDAPPHVRDALRTLAEWECQHRADLSEEEHEAVFADEMPWGPDQADDDDSPDALADRRLGWLMRVVIGEGGCDWSEVASVAAVFATGARPSRESLRRLQRRYAEWLLALERNGELEEVEADRLVELRGTDPDLVAELEAKHAAPGATVHTLDKGRKPMVKFDPNTRRKPEKP